MPKVQLTASTAMPPLTDQRDQLADQPSVPARVNAVQVRIASPADALQTLAAEHHLQVEEWDTSTLDENLRNKLLAHYLERKDGTPILVVPAGQDPVVRLNAVRALLAHLAVTA